MKPQQSYTIWFTQRTGSTLLRKALESTGIAGNPREWFNCQPDLLDFFTKRITPTSRRIYGNLELHPTAFLESIIHSMNRISVY